MTNLPVIEKVTLSNNIPVILINTPNLNTCCMTLHIRAGSCFETPDINGISHLLEHMYFRSKSTGEKLCSVELEMLGADINAYTTQDTVSFTLSLLNEDLIKSVPHLISLFKNLSSHYFETEKKIIIEELLEDRNSKGEVIDIHQLIASKLWGEDSPLGLSIGGTPESISNLRIQHLENFHAKHFNTNNISISCASKIPRDLFIPQLEHFTRWIPKGSRISLLKVPTKSNIKELILKDHDQGTVETCISFKTIGESNHNLIYPLIIRQILGEGMASRLYDVICTQKGLCYDISSEFNYSIDAGTFSILAESSPENVVPILKTIIFIIKDFQKNEISKEDHAMQLKKIHYELMTMIDDPYSLSCTYGTTLLHGIDYSIEKRIHQIQTLKPKSIKEFSQSLFSTSNMALACIGPISEIEKNIENLFYAIDL